MRASVVRTWQGAELIYRKRMSNNWQMLGSYSYADGKGNTNSDSNADFQGDVLWLDPRAPNQEGTQPGLVEHLFKVAGTYQWDNGVSVGGAYRWNSGAIVSRTFSASWFGWSRAASSSSGIASSGRPAWRYWEARL